MYLWKKKLYNFFFPKYMYCGKKNLYSFFENWVFDGGYPDYSVDSIKLLFSPVDAPTLAKVFVKQKLRGTQNYHHEAPLEFTFLMSDGQRQYKTGMVSGVNTLLEFQFPAFGPIPLAVFVNTNLKILQARGEGEKMLKTSGNSNFSDAKFNLTVNTLGADSVLFRVEHHFAAPDNAGANPNNYNLTNRYWSVSTNGSAFPAGFNAQATLIYDGRGQGDQLDTEFFTYSSPSEDSVLLLYRPGAGHPWQQWPTYTKITLGSTSDTYGQLRPTNLLPGEYTIGKGLSTIATNEPNYLGKIQVSPNPTSGSVHIQTTETFDRATLINADGQMEKTWEFTATTTADFDLKAFPVGQYWMLLNGKKGTAICGVVLGY
jgi:aminopeptidase N